MSAGDALGFLDVARSIGRLEHGAAVTVGENEDAAGGGPRATDIIGDVYLSNWRIHASRVATTGPLPRPCA